MKGYMFKTLTELEKKAMLTGVLIKRTGGRLDKLRIESVINNLDINIQYGIKVFEDAKEFGKAITLPNHIMEHSWAGSKEHIGQGINLLGTDLVFGESKTYEYSGNGNITKDEKEMTLPDFGMLDIHAVYVFEHNKSTYEGNEYDNKYNHIYVYLPSGNPFIMNPDVEYILANFDLSKPKLGFVGVE